MDRHFFLQSHDLTIATMAIIHRRATKPAIMTFSQRKIASSINGSPEHPVPSPLFAWSPPLFNYCVDAEANGRDCGSHDSYFEPDILTLKGFGLGLCLLELLVEVRSRRCQVPPQLCHQNLQVLQLLCQSRHFLRDLLGGLRRAACLIRLHLL